MTREREELLSRVRHAEDPTLADEERVLRALQAALVARSETSLQPSRRAEAWTKLAAQPGAVLKLSALVVAVAVSGAVLWRTSWPADPSLPVGREAAPREIVAVPSGPPPEPAAAARAAPASLVEAPAPSGEAAPPELPAPGQQAAPETQSGTSRSLTRETLERRRTPRSGRAAARGAASLRAEVALLERVQAALRRGDGAAALRELEGHRTADRVLLAERAAARILALCLVGRVAEARRAAERFAEQHPDSAQSAAIASSCANSRRIEEP